MELKDTLSAKKSLILLLTFYVIDEKNEKSFLHNHLINHSLFKNMEFWTAAVYSSLTEEIIEKKKMQTTESMLDAEYREKNLIFGTLASYCQNMLIFKIDKKIVRDFAEGFCEKFSLESHRIEELKVNTKKLIIYR